MVLASGTGPRPAKPESEEGCPRSPGRAARFAAVKQDIRDNLGDPDLSLHSLSKRHGMSPRAIRNLFYAHGTNFTDWLMNARLDQARTMLTDPCQRHTNISEIALSSGFGDISWFHQVFRRRFGMTPAKMREEGSFPNPIPHD
jgi:AraC-like DNA-binding protein